jgi:hypothetical protein
MNNQINEELGSYVMSVLTGTMTGWLMSADEVCAAIVGNGWAGPEGLRPIVVAELKSLCAQGSVQQVGHRYRMADSVVASILDQLDDSGDPQ